VKANVVIEAQETDRPTEALIQDLKQRGMLDDTLVVWGGEFGRTPVSGRWPGPPYQGLQLPAGVGVAPRTILMLGVPAGTS
jgi:arylsulfatase A-like enzyme